MPECQTHVYYETWEFEHDWITPTLFSVLVLTKFWSNFEYWESHIEHTVNTLWLGDMIFQNFPKCSPSKKIEINFFSKWKFLEIFLFSDNIIVWRSRLVLQKCAEPTPTYRNQLSFFQFTLLPFINPWCRWHLLQGWI